MGKAPRKAPGVAELPPVDATAEELTEMSPSSATDKELAELADAISRATITEHVPTGITFPEDEALLGGTIPVAIRHVEILGVDDERAVEPGSLIVVCREPGFRRAGMAHPAVAVYPLDRFSGSEIAAMEAAPELELIAVR